MKQIIKIEKNNGINSGYCKSCLKYFKKNSYIIYFEKCKLNKITEIKICVECYIKQLAEKIGWKKLNALILKMFENKI